jgi:hypothetical protein
MTKSFNATNSTCFGLLVKVLLFFPLTQYMPYYTVETYKRSWYGKVIEMLNWHDMMAAAREQPLFKSTLYKAE